MMRLNRKAFVAALAALSFLGFLDASFLAVEHYVNAVPPCSIVKGCEIVTTSSYATLEGTYTAMTGRAFAPIIPGGISVALLGSMYYLAFFLATIAAWSSDAGWFLRILPFTAVGFLASGWFLYVQTALLGAICLYCIFSAFISTLLFFTSMGLIYWSRTHENQAL